MVVTRSGTAMGFSIEGRPSGQGEISLPWALEQLGQFGTGHTTIIELWPPWQGGIEETVKLEKQWVAESVDYLKSLN